MTAALVAAAVNSDAQQAKPSTQFIQTPGMVMNTAESTTIVPVAKVIFDCYCKNLGWSLN